MEIKEPLPNLSDQLPTVLHVHGILKGEYSHPRMANPVSRNQNNWNNQDGLNSDLHADTWLDQVSAVKKKNPSRDFLNVLHHLPCTNIRDRNVYINSVSSNNLFDFFLAGVWGSPQLGLAWRHSGNRWDSQSSQQVCLLVLPK